MSDTLSGSVRRSPLRHWALVIVGWLFLLVGIVGFVLPVMQGWPFVAIGMAILARVQPWARRAKERFAVRFPALGAAMTRAEETAEGWLRRLAGRRAAATPPRP